MELALNMHKRKFIYCLIEMKSSYCMFNHFHLPTNNRLNMEFVNKGLYCVYNRDTPLNKQIDSAMIFKYYKPQLHILDCSFVIDKI